MEILVRAKQRLLEGCLRAWVNRVASKALPTLYLKPILLRGYTSITLIFIESVIKTNLKIRVLEKTLVGL